MKSFRVYFPEGCDSLGAFAVHELPTIIKQVKHNMAATSLKQPNVVIYPSSDQQYESNIGLFEPEPFSFPSFLTKGNRMVISYNGSYEDLREQLQESVARSIWENQFKPDSDGATANKSLQDIPYWFKEGAIKYFANGWSISAEDVLKRTFKQRKFHSWNEVISYQPKRSGHAFCYFLTETYGKYTLLQIQTQLRKKNLRRSLRLITKRPMDSLLRQCYSFYRNRFAVSVDTVSALNGQVLAVKIKSKNIRDLHIRDLRLSPDGNTLAYVAHEYSQRTVYLLDVKTYRTKKLYTYKLAPWLTDHSLDNYPLIEWNGSNDLEVLAPIKGKLRIQNYSSAGVKLEGTTLYGVEGVTQFAAINRGYVLSAFRKGQSDIVRYDVLKEKYTPLTSDRFDDGNFAVSTLNTSDVYLASKRPEKELRKWDTVKLKQGIFQATAGKVIPVITDSTKHVVWDKPVMLSDGNLLVTHTKFGTERFAIRSPQSGQIQALSEYAPIQYLPALNQVVSYGKDGDSIRIYRQPLDAWLEANKSNDSTSPWLDDYKRREAEDAKIDSMLNSLKDQEPSFASGILMPKNSKQGAKSRRDSIARVKEYNNSKKAKPYILHLHSAYFTAKVNNDYFINRYQPYLNYQGQFKFPEVGGMIQGGLTDLFENHHINIAFRMPSSTEGSDFFIKYENTARKVDWGVTYFRKVESLQPDPRRDWKDENGKPYPNAAKVKTHYYEVSVKYPLSYYLSAGFQTAIRNDRTIFLATERYSLNFPDIKSLWSISTFSLTMNKLQPTVPLLSKGYRWKALSDVFKGFTQDEPALLGATVHAEYHLPIYRYITAVVQAKTGFSAGDNYLLYNLGGTDNNVMPKIDSSVVFPQTAPYAFQSLVTPFRGYKQNSLYGNRYALVNADVYFPLFQTLIPVETPINAMNLLQPGLFADMATAKETWEGSAPGKGAQYSYGFSLRTKLANYPLRVDVAWPGTFHKKPIWYLSLNLK